MATSEKEPDESSSPTPIPFAGSMLRQHRHVFALFSPPKEDYETPPPFICDSLNRGQRAFHVLPSKYRDDHLDQLGKAGVDVEAGQRSRQLEVALREDTHLKTRRLTRMRYSRSSRRRSRPARRMADPHDCTRGNRRG
jgi:hypothetical protein